MIKVNDLIKIECKCQMIVKSEHKHIVIKSNKGIRSLKSTIAFFMNFRYRIIYIVDCLNPVTFHELLINFLPRDFAIFISFESFLLSLAFVNGYQKD